MCLVSMYMCSINICVCTCACETHRLKEQAEADARRRSTMHEMQDREVSLRKEMEDAAKSHDAALGRALAQLNDSQVRALIRDASMLLNHPCVCAIYACIHVGGCACVRACVCVCVCVGFGCSTQRLAGRGRAGGHIKLKTQNPQHQPLDHKPETPKAKCPTGAGGRAGGPD